MSRKKSGGGVEGGGFRRFRRPRIPGGLPARRILWIGGAAVVFYLFVLSDFGLLQRWRLARESARVEARIEALQQQEKELESQQDVLDEDAALERAAREEHGMVRPGEHVYRLAVPDSTGSGDGGR